ncbi:MAG: Sjogren's syndrome/scleroderma autoantigen 1 family protein [Methanotrichaceae archaeon]
MDEDDVIKRMTRLLELGGTMLAVHHDCGTPLFRYEGRVVCPKCSFDEIDDALVLSQEKKIDEQAISKNGSVSSVGGSPVEPNEADAMDTKKPDESGVTNEISLSPGSTATAEMSFHKTEAEEIDESSREDSVRDELRSDLLYKLRELSGAMRDEQDLSRLKSQLKCIEEALNVLATLDK